MQVGAHSMLKFKTCVDLHQLASTCISVWPKLTEAKRSGMTKLIDRLPEKDTQIVNFMNKIELKKKFLQIQRNRTFDF